MAFDGITIANIVKDLQDNLIDGRLSKSPSLNLTSCSARLKAKTVSSVSVSLQALPCRSSI